MRSGERRWKRSVAKRALATLDDVRDPKVLASGLDEVERPTCSIRNLDGVDVFTRVGGDNNTHRSTRMAVNLVRELDDGELRNVGCDSQFLSWRER